MGTTNSNEGERMDTEYVVDQVNYIVHPTYVERFDTPDGDLISRAESTDCYDELVEFGYPITNDAALGGYYIDVAVCPHGDRMEMCVVFTSHPAAEHDMGQMSGLFISWTMLLDFD